MLEIYIIPFSLLFRSICYDAQRTNNTFEQVNKCIGRILFGRWINDKPVSKLDWLQEFHKFQVIAPIGSFIQFLDSTCNKIETLEKW